MGFPPHRHPAPSRPLGTGARSGSLALVLGGLVLASGSLPARAQTTGLLPLSDLGSGLYQGYRGGLYPGGTNAPPAAHRTAALAMAAQIVPRNAAGSPDPQGLIAMIAVGMSNTTHEFGAFERNADADPNRNARLVIVDTAFGGQTAAAIANPQAAYWTTMSQRLQAMGISAAQVQVAWLKEADAQPPDNFPVHAPILRDELEIIANNLHDKFPNLRLCYVSSRIYGGYASPGSLNPEPQAYESGFSVKWLIEAQIAGDTGLNYGQLPGPVRAPLLLWGPYLWADGTDPRSDGLTWLVSDLESDHTHPSPSGEEKVAAQLVRFFAAEPTAAGWWPARRTDAALVAVAATKDAHVSSASPGTNFGSAATLLEQGGASPINDYLGFDVGSVPRPYLLAKLSARVLSGGGGRVSLVADTAWTESGITFATAPAIGSSLQNMPSSSRDGTIGAQVTSAVNADADGLLSFALTTTVAQQLSYHTKEASQPPRLVAVVPCANAPDGDGDGRTDVCDCAPSESGTFAPPPEADGLLWTSKTSLAWSSLAPSAGPGIRYDLVSGSLDEVAMLGSGGPSDVCVVENGSAPSAADTTSLPAPGHGVFFLVRGDDACGKGRYETSSDLRDRATLACQ